MNARLAACACFAAVALAGCKNIPVPDVPGVTPYRIEVQQGNYVSQDMVDKLKPGMSRDQVRFILGTPLVTDIFHADRWDYVYWREMPGKPRERRRLAVYFEAGRLKRVDGDVLPAEAKVAPEEAKPAPASAKPAAKDAQPAAKDAAPASGAKTAEAPAPKTDETKADDAKKDDAKKDGASERGFFGRLLEKIGF